MNTTRATARTALAGLAASATMITAALAMNGPAAAPAWAAAGPAVPAGQPGTGPVSGQALLSRPAAVPPGHVSPLWRLPHGTRPGRYPGQHAAPDTIGEPGGYDPGELRAYLGLHGTGAGQTVAVTEAFNVNDAQALTTALSAYDSWNGLPPACSATISTGCFHLTFVAPHGTCHTEVNPSDCLRGENIWEVEAELDVELIHGLAPQAAITVIEGHDDTVASMMAAIDYAQSRHPAAVSNSWTTDEFAGERALDSHCPATGPVCVFASGDSGNYPSCRAENGTSVTCGGYPAASPDVLTVGGTTLNLAATGKVLSETAWPGSGGGISGYEPLPAYQQKTDPWPSGRGIPDVSFDADPNSGIAIYGDQAITYHGQVFQFGQGWIEVGGTSVGAPAWAAILAAAAQLRTAAGQPPLTIAAVHAAVYAKTRKKPVADITTGTNGICGPQCSARPGYDLVTGEGSPRPGIAAYLATH